nr:uncharacterized protein LOC128705220 [Cherax quadricarinatus]
MEKEIQFSRALTDKDITKQLNNVLEFLKIYKYKETDDLNETIEKLLYNSASIIYKVDMRYKTICKLIHKMNGPLKNTLLIDSYNIYKAMCKKMDNLKEFCITLIITKKKLLQYSRHELQLYFNQYSIHSFSYDDLLKISQDLKKFTNRGICRCSEKFSEENLIFEFKMCEFCLDERKLCNEAVQKFTDLLDLSGRIVDHNTYKTELDVEINDFKGSIKSLMSNQILCKLNYIKNYRRGYINPLGFEIDFIYFLKETTHILEGIPENDKKLMYLMIGQKCDEISCVFLYYNNKYNDEDRVNEEQLNFLFRLENYLMVYLNRSKVIFNSEGIFKNGNININYFLKTGNFSVDNSHEKKQFPFSLNHILHVNVHLDDYTSKERKTYKLMDVIEEKRGSIITYKLKEQQNSNILKPSRSFRIEDKEKIINHIKLNDGLLNNEVSKIFKNPLQTCIKKNDKEIIRTSSNEKEMYQNLKQKEVIKIETKNNAILRSLKYRENGLKKKEIYKTIKATIDLSK